MNIIQIFDKNVADDKLSDAIEKLKAVHVDISRYDYTIEGDKFDTNEKVARLMYFYGEKILPITLVNGEVVQVEKNLTVGQLISESDITATRLQKSGLLNTTEASCGGCGGCASKSKTNGCAGCKSGCKKEAKETN